MLSHCPPSRSGFISSCILSTSPLFSCCESSWSILGPLSQTLCLSLSFVQNRSNVMTLIFMSYCSVSQPFFNKSSGMGILLYRIGTRLKATSTNTLWSSGSCIRYLRRASTLLQVVKTTLSRSSLGFIQLW